MGWQLDDGPVVWRDGIVTTVNDHYEGFGALKGVQPVPWGRVRGSVMFPWYFTWVTACGFGFVLFVVAPLLWLTEARWLSLVGISVVPVLWIDWIATTVIVVRRNRRKKRSKRS